MASWLPGKMMKTHAFRRVVQRRNLCVSPRFCCHQELAPGIPALFLNGTPSPVIQRQLGWPGSAGPQRCVSGFLAPIPSGLPPPAGLRAASARADRSDFNNKDAKHALFLPFSSRLTVTQVSGRKSRGVAVMSGSMFETGNACVSAWRSLPALVRESRSATHSPVQPLGAARGA